MHSLTWRRLTLGVALVALMAAPAWCDVPRFAEVVGHDFGERITVHHQMVAYLETLDEASPRVSVVDQGTSWEGRRLLLAIVTSPANHARLDAIRDAAQQLADPRRVASESVDALVADQPAVLWMGGSIHGFELSGSEGLLKLLELLTTGDDKATGMLLENTVVLIDPMINPDGRDAFAHANHRRLGGGGTTPNPLRVDWNNDWTRWQALGFRTGHYFFDTNRDWFAHTQAETRARWPTIQEWRPQVVIDAHEMGADVEFYFDPPAEPFPPSFPAFARDGFARFGKVYADAFDDRGFEYMTGEQFNYFYPGYTTSWGSFQGAVGMLYEQGSSRGLAMTRADDSVRTLADALEQQFTAARAAVSHAASHREELLRAYHDAHRQAVGAVADGPRRYLIPRVSATGDPGARADLLALLARNGIEVGYTTSEVVLDDVLDRAGRTVERQTFTSGTAVVEVAQPRRDLVTVLLAPDQPLPEDFLVAARERVARGENPRFYDITAWSLPLLFDVAAFSTRATLDSDVLDTLPPVLRAPPEKAGYAYLIDGRDARTPAVLHELGSMGHRVAVALAGTTIDGVAVTRGSGVVRVGQNEASIHDAVHAVTSRRGVAVRAVDTGLGGLGEPALGSADVVPMRARGIALLAEEPVDAYSFGWAWWVLDQQFGLPTTVVRAGSLAGVDLSPFGTLVMPDLADASALGTTLGDAGLARLRQWIGDGGCLVVLGAATDFAREHLELALQSVGPDAPEDTDENVERRYAVPGAILRTQLDPHAWLTSGLADDLPFLVFSDRVYRLPASPPDPSRRIAARVASEDPLIAGHAWAPSLERLPDAAMVYEQRVGRGRIVSFAEDVNFRGYWRGSDRLFLNAVVVGPSAP